MSVAGSESSLGSRLEALKYLDFFGYSPVYQFHRYRSAVGALASMVVAVVMSLFLLLEIVAFVTTDPDQLEATRAMDWDLVVTPPRFGMAVRNDSGIISNASIFSFEFEQLTNVNGVRDVSQSRIFEQQECTFADRDGSVVFRATCPTDMGSMQGTFESEVFTYVKVTLEACTGRPECLAPDTINAIMSESEVSFVFEDTVYVDGRSDHRLTEARSIRVKLQEAQIPFWDLFFVKRKYTFVPRYLVDFSSPINLVQLESIDKLVDDRGERARYGTWFLRLSRLSTKTTVTSTTLLGLLGSWGALWSFMTFLFGLVIAHPYNKKKFFRTLQGRDLRLLNADQFSRFGILQLEDFEETTIDYQTAKTGGAWKGGPSDKAAETARAHARMLSGSATHSMLPPVARGASPAPAGGGSLMYDANGDPVPVPGARPASGGEAFDANRLLAWYLKDQTGNGNGAVHTGPGAGGGAAGAGGAGGGADAPLPPIRLQRLTGEQLEELLTALFRYSDHDKSGFLNQAEFESLLGHPALGLKKPEIADLYRKADVTADGLVSYAEFVPVAVKYLRARSAKTSFKKLESEDKEAKEATEMFLVHGCTKEELEERLMRMFRASDADGNGVLSRPEIEKALVELGCTRTEIEYLIEETDQNKDGLISYEEFVPTCYQLLVKLLADDYVDRRARTRQWEDFLTKTLQRKDSGRTGVLPFSKIRKALFAVDIGMDHQAMMQYVLSVIPESQHAAVPYPQYIPQMAGEIQAYRLHRRVADHDRKQVALVELATTYKMRSHQRSQFTSSLAAQFRRADPAKRGFVSRSVFVQCLRDACSTTDLDLKDKDLQRLIDTARYDRHGNVVYKDFVQAAYDQLLSRTRSRGSTLVESLKAASPLPSIAGDSEAPAPPMAAAGRQRWSPPGAVPTVGASNDSVREPAEIPADAYYGRDRGYERWERRERARGRRGRTDDRGGRFSRSKSAERRAKSRSRSRSRPPRAPRAIEAEPPAALGKRKQRHRKREREREPKPEPEPCPVERVAYTGVASGLLTDNGTSEDDEAGRSASGSADETGSGSGSGSGSE